MIRIAEAAQRLNVHPDTLRGLEARGLFTPQRDYAGHRRYSDEDLTRLRGVLYPSSTGSRQPSPDRASE